MHFGTASFCIVSIKNRTNFLDTLFLLKCTTLQRVTKKGKNVTPAEQDPKQSLLFMPLRSPVLFPVDLHHCTEAISSVMTKVEMAKNIHLQKWKLLAIFKCETFLPFEGANSIETAFNRKDL